jgi:hypothetical protein
MEVKKRTDNGFILSNSRHTVECDFRENRAVIFQNNEVKHYCKLVFPSAWDVSNLIQIVDIVRNEVLFEVDLVGSEFEEWVRQLLKAFASYLKDSEVIIGYYEIDGIRIAKCL